MHLDLLRDKSATFPSAAIPTGLDSLCVWHCKYKTLRPIAELRQLAEQTADTARHQRMAELADQWEEFANELGKDS